MPAEHALPVPELGSQLFSSIRTMSWLSTSTLIIVGGVSYIIGLGDYEGGELLVYYDGENVPPTGVDIKHKFYTFDGSRF